MTCIEMKSHIERTIETTSGVVVDRMVKCGDKSVDDDSAGGIT